MSKKNKVKVFSIKDLFHVMTDNDLIESVMPIGWKPEKEVKAAAEKHEANKETTKKAESKPQTPKKVTTDVKEKSATVPSMGAPVKEKDKKNPTPAEKKEVAIELATPATHTDKIVQAVAEGVEKGDLVATVASASSTRNPLYYAEDENGNIVTDQQGNPLMYELPWLWSWEKRCWTLNQHPQHQAV